MASVHKNLRWRVIELCRVHRADDRDVVRVSGQVRQDVRYLLAGLAVLFELERRAEQSRRAFDEGEPLAFDVFIRAWLAVEFAERRFVVEQVERRGRAGHKQIDDMFGFRREMPNALDAFSSEDVLVE